MPKSSRPPDDDVDGRGDLGEDGGAAGKRLLVTSRADAHSRSGSALARAASKRPAFEDRASGSPPIGIRWSNNQACAISGVASASRQTRWTSA
jgi:hypothetical protein